MKKLIPIILTLVLVFTGIMTVTSSAAESDSITYNLLPAANDANGKVTASGCDVVYNDDGTVTITITGSSPTVLVEYVTDGTILADAAFKPADGAYVVVDYGSADGADFDNNTIAYYTRKDKGEKSAELWLASMRSTTDAALIKRQKAIGEGYSIWDLGQYLLVDKGASALFEDGVHRFTSLSLVLTGDVGSSLTLYRFYVGTADAVEGLGAVRPEPPVVEDPSEEPVESEEPIESEEPVESQEPVESAEPIESQEPVESTPAEESETAPATSNDSTAGTDDKEEEKGGCSSSVASAAVILTSVFGLAIGFTRKRK